MDDTATAQLDQDLPQVSPDELGAQLLPEEEKKQSSLGAFIIMSSILASRFGRTRTQIMEGDPAFKKSITEARMDWLRRNPGKDLTTQEGLDFEEKELLGKAREHFRANTSRSWAGRRKLKRYDKNKGIIKNPSNDPLLKLYNKGGLLGIHAERLIDAKYKFLLEKNPTITRENVQEMIQNSIWDSFVKEFPEKAAAYSRDNTENINILGGSVKTGLKEALERSAKEKESPAPSPTPQPPPTAQTNYSTKEALLNYYSERGKEVKLVDSKIHKAKDEPTVDEATRILETGSKGLKGESLVDVHGNPLSSGSISSLSQSGSQKIEGAVDLNYLEEEGVRKFIPIQPIRRIEQTDSQMETIQVPGRIRVQRRSVRITRGAINFSNKAMRGGKNAIKFAKNAAKIGQMGARAIPLLANPVTWIVIGILIVLLLLILVLLVILGVFGGPAELPFIFGLRLEKAASPTHVDNGGGKEIIYKITAAYSGDKDIVITDRIPSGTQFVSATPGTAGKEYRFENGAVTWRLKDNEPKGTKQLPGDCPRCGPKTESSYEFTVTIITLKAADDSIIENKAVAGIVGSGAIDISSKTLAEFFTGSALQYKVPVALLKAIASTESQVLGYAEGEVSQFSARQWWSGRVDNAINLSSNDSLIIRGYGYNTCQPSYGAGCAPGSDVRGTTQFEIKTWNGIKGNLTFSDGHDPDRRYVADAIFGQGAFIRNIANQYENRYLFSQSDTDWTEEQVKAVARTYCGGNPDADVSVKACAQGGKTYDQVVWGYYLEFKGKN